MSIAISQERTFTSFAGDRRLVSADLGAMLRETKRYLDQGGSEVVLIFEDQTGRQVDFDFRGQPDEVIERASTLPYLEPVRTGPGRPKLGVVSREVTLTLSPEWTAATGADALSHAMEAYWNKHHNPVSDVYALEAVRRIFEALPLAFTNPSNLAHRSKMLFASLLAGMAFSNTKTAAAHSLSYPMTLHYGVVHGQGSSITLPALLRFNEQASRERMTDLARAVGGNSVDSGARRIQVLLQRIGLKTSLSELGIDAQGIDMCVREGYTPDRAGNNLRDLDADGMREILTMVA